MIQLFLRDVGLSVRSGGGFGLALIFFLIVVTLIPLALGPDQTALAVVAPGVLWLGALLACLLSLDRIFGLDFEDGTLDLLATSPLPPVRGAPSPSPVRAERRAARMALRRLERTFSLRRTFAARAAICASRCLRGRRVAITSRTLARPAASWGSP